MKKQRIKAGDVLKVIIDNDTHTYARILNGADVAFYDCRTKEDIADLEKIIHSNVICIIAVDKSVLTQGEWPKIGNIPLEKNLQTSPLKYIKEAGEEKYQIYDNGIIRPSTREECIGLELVASWSKSNVEERLQSYFSNTPSKLMEIYGPLKST